jgi:sorbose reductase
MIKQGSGGSIVLIACKYYYFHQRNPMLTIQTALSGHIVNYPQPQMAYNVSKSAVLHMKHCLAAEWARYGIRTNTISPGYMDTILNEGLGLEDARKVWNERNPMGRMGLPQELAGPLVLLCSDAGSYMNGADLVVDGEIDGRYVTFQC